MKRYVAMGVSMAVLGIVILFCGCGKDTVVSENGPDPECAQAKVNAANDLLENVLYSLINSDEIDEPDDIDLSGPYDLYMEAIACDASHIAANFGAGILEVVMLTQDPEIQTAFDQWKNLIDTGDYFEAAGPLEGPLPLTGPVLRIDEVTIPFYISLGITRGQCRLTSQGDPTIDELQTIFLNEVLPRVNTAISRLNLVTGDDSFAYYVTPMMQGDANEDPVELDLTEVYATLAGLNAVKAALLHFCAYDLNLDAYTGEEMINALTQGSSFATLHSQGESRMSSARLAWLDAADYLDAGIQFFENETDNQSDDFIKLDMDDDFTQQELDSLKHYLPKVRNALNSSETFTFELDGNYEDIEISLYSLYDSPVQDLKELFPPYTVTGLDIQEIWEYHSDDSTISATVVVDTYDYCQWYRSASYSYGQENYYYEYINLDVPEFEAAWNAKVAQLADKPSAYLSFYFYEYLDPGTHEISLHAYWDYNEIVYRYVPLITWDADSYYEWIFPDPTMGGLMPGMTDSRFKDIFNFNPEDWEKTQTWELW